MTTQNISLASLATILGVIATIIAAVISGIFSFTLQKNNSRSLLSKYREKWQSETRQYMSKYIYNAALIVFRAQDDETYIKTDDFNKVYSELTINQILFLSMLDPSKNYYDYFDKKFQEISGIFIAGIESNPEEISKALDDIHIAAIIILEKSWADIKKDCGVKINKNLQLPERAKNISESFNIEMENPRGPTWRVNLLSLGARSNARIGKQ